ncbi:peptide chain release factor 1 [Lachnoclostridium sp. Marseille-P6806]|uniref:peptide chain release factor 1 n=1 Tax=Lachnoclostridium sp. Marseille-P6806 TaxID=2364793 RepID=UPI001031350C|nr:peptide chain release factor 1 [Lachnoclostridium sp. Marseille-P6806]
MLNKLQALSVRSEDITRELAELGTANDQGRFRSLMKEQNELRPLVETFSAYQRALRDMEDSLSLMEGETDPEMKSMLREELAAAKASAAEREEELRVLLLPKDPNDERDVIIELRAGAGGDEAALFAAELYRMYVHYAEKRGWRVATEEYEEIGIGGMKNVTFTVSGQGAFSRFKYESGVHRVQRVPETESGGRIHTSTCTVAVMPEISDEIGLDIPASDVRMDITRASGNGGQGVNTTDSAVRLTHLPTGIVIYSQTERSQLQNKAKAWALLRSKLYDLEQQRRHDEEADLRRSQVGTGDRSEKIRTYNFPQGRVTDHRIKLTLHRIEDILEGDLDELIDALTAADQAAKLLKMSERESSVL